MPCLFGLVGPATLPMGPFRRRGHDIGGFLTPSGACACHANIVTDNLVDLVQARSDAFAS